MKPGFLPLVCVVALVAGGLYARHERLRTAREVEAAAAALDEARALGERLSIGPVTSFVAGAIDGGRLSLASGAWTGRRSSEEALTLAGRALRGERVTGPALGSAWGVGVVDGTARARVLVGWKVGPEEVELLLVEVRRAVE